MPPEPAPLETLPARILAVLGAQCVFAVITRLLVGAPPAFLTIAVFGATLALALEIQARRAPAGET